MVRSTFNSTSSGLYSLSRKWLKAILYLGLVGLIFTKPSLTYGQDQYITPVGFKLTIPIISTYKMDQHLFSSIAQNSFYKDSSYITNVSLAVWGDKTDLNLSGFAKFLSYMPQFGLEYLWNIHLPYGGAFSVGASYWHFYQTENDALPNLTIKNPNTPSLSADLYLFLMPLRYFLLRSTPESINPFVGLGIGFLKSSVLFDFSSIPSASGSFYSFPVGSVSVGVDTTVANIGSRIELLYIMARSAPINQNWYPDALANKRINASGLLLTVSFLWLFT